MAQVRKEHGLADDSWAAMVSQILAIPVGLKPNFAAYVDEHATALGPDWAAALALFQRYASADGHPDRARVLYECRLSSLPACAFVERWMGDVCLYRLGVLHRARRHYQAATIAAPAHAPAHFQLGQVCFLLGVFDRARAAWERAVAVAGPGDEEPAARSLFNLGALLVDSPSIGKGQGLIRQALELMPDYPEADAALARLEAFQRWA